MARINDIITPLELHSVQEIKKCFSEGVSPNAIYNNEPLIYELTSEYTRSEKFKDCVRAFIDAGLEFDDKALLAVLADDSFKLQEILKHNPESIQKKYSLRCAYTPLYKITLLHICAEFDHVSCAKVLVEYGADINATSGIDENGFGGQTPIFHTVNQNNNQSLGMLNYLFSLGADLHITVKGLIWGKGYEWETLIPSVNPVSYAMMGLLPQMHKNEKTISETISLLLKQGYGIEYKQQNIPNKYLVKD